jgi:hypothetical protein
MNNVKRTVAAVVLTLALGLTTFAGETQTPPCASPDPGILQTPPCSGGQTAPDDPAVPGQMDAPTASAAADATALAISLFESLLPLF